MGEKKFIRVTVWLVIAALVAACAPVRPVATPREAARPLATTTATPPPASPEATSAGEEAIMVKPSTLRQGDQWPTRGGQRFVLITGPNAWATFLRQQRGQPDAWPAVDWEHEVVLVALMGGKRTGGYRITMKDIKVQGGEVLVRVEELSPRPGEMVIQVLTSPFHVVTVPRETFPPTPFTLRFVTPAGSWEVQVTDMAGDTTYEARPTGQGLIRPAEGEK